MNERTPSRRRATPRILTLAVSLGLLLSGCSWLAPPAPQIAPTDAPIPGTASALQAEQFSAYYAQDVEWYECSDYDGYTRDTADALAQMGYDPDDIACGIVSAPFDWHDPENTQQIELSISWLPALGDEPAAGTLFTNPGGPGSTGTDYAFDTALSQNFEPVAERYDIVGMDPRGVGGSTPIDCATDYSGDVFTGLADCVERNPLARTMGTEQVARDLELLRHLVQDTKFNYLGVSYGTMLGGTYAQLFPERVGRMVLDSAESAGWASLTHAFDQQVAISDATVALALTCTTDLTDLVEVCPFTDEDTLGAVIAQVQREPLVSSDGNTLNGTDLAWYLSTLLYEDEEAQAQGLDTLALALFGDPDAIDEVVANGGGSTTDLILKTITCHSAPPEHDREALAARIAEVGIPKMWGGPEETEATLQPFFDTSCDGLPEHGSDYVEAYTAPDAAPVLVLGVTGDHATPYEHGQRFAAELGNATFVTLDGPGHGASYMGRSRCIDDLTTAYLRDGELPPDGTVCFDD